MFYQRFNNVSFALLYHHYPNASSQITSHYKSKRQKKKKVTPSIEIDGISKSQISMFRIAHHKFPNKNTTFVSFKHNLNHIHYNLKTRN